MKRLFIAIDYIVLIFSLIFVVIGVDLFYHQKISLLSFFAGMVFFGGGVIFMIFKIKTQPSNFILNNDSLGKNQKEFLRWLSLIMLLGGTCYYLNSNASVLLKVVIVLASIYFILAFLFFKK